MRISLCLAEILERHGIPRHGMIMHVVRKTGLERHKVAAILQNEAHKLRLDELGRICDYLVEHHNFDRLSLPGALFGHQTWDFWGLLTQRDLVDVCFAVRSDPTDVDHSWVAAADAQLNGQIINEFTGFGTRPAAERDGTKYLHHHQTLVPAYGPRIDASVGPEGDEIRKQGQKIYDQFDRNSAGRALVALGSMKSNTVSEIIIARAFGMQPFRSQDAVRSPKERGCPFYFLYRPNDRKPPSCAGGTRLAVARAGEKPGIHYEVGPQEWEHCPQDDTHDAGIIFYHFEPPTQRVEMVIAGFSPRSTRGLGRVLLTREKELWPPAYVSGAKECGLFVVKLVFPQAKKVKKGGAPLPVDLDYLLPDPIDVKVIRVSQDVLARRFERGSSSRPARLGATKVGQNGRKPK